MGILEKTAIMRRRGCSADEIALAIRSHQRRRTFMNWAGAVAVGIGIAIVAAEHLQFETHLRIIKDTYFSKVNAIGEVGEEISEQRQQLTQQSNETNQLKVIVYNGLKDPKRIWITEISYDELLKVEINEKQIIVYTDENAGITTTDMDAQTGRITQKIVLPRPHHPTQKVECGAIYWRKGHIVDFDRPPGFIDSLFNGPARKQLRYCDKEVREDSEAYDRYLAELKEYYRQKFSRNEITKINFPYTFQTSTGEDMQLELTSDTFFGVKNGQIMWRTRTGIEHVDALTVNEITGTRNAALYKNMLFMQYADETIDAINLETGGIIWRKVNMPLDIELRINNGRVVLEHELGIMLLDIQTGNRILEFKMDSEGPWHFLGEDNKRYYIGNRAKVIAFEK